jgi:hypothetical protein
MTSHEYATEIRKQADYLESRPVFEIPGSERTFFCFYDKHKFLDAVRALAPGTKEYKYDDLDFTISAVSIVLSIPRNRVCKLVAPAVWDCEPLLSLQEDAALRDLGVQS